MPAIKVIIIGHNGLLHAKNRPSPWFGQAAVLRLGAAASYFMDRFDFSRNLLG